MKKTIGILSLVLITATTVVAQERHTVLSITDEMHEVSWYIEQQKLWGDDTQKDKTNAEAWYNYYSATRALKNLAEDSTSRADYRTQCTQIAEDAYKAVPKTFEANHLMWWDSYNDEAKRHYLFEAAKISPNDSRAFDDLMVCYEIMRDTKNFDATCKRIYESGELPPSLMNWGYNLLSELEPNAIVFVRGDYDTYALWITKSVKGIRSDITIVNTSLMRMDEYRERILKELNYPSFTGEYHDLFPFMIENRKDHTVHVSSSAIQSFNNTPIMDSLYLVGLSYLYCENQIDNVSVIRRNYEKRYMIDYLKERFSVHPFSASAAQFDKLYIPSMIKLYKHYRDSEATENMKNMESLLLKLSKESGDKEMVEKLISEK